MGSAASIRQRGRRRVTRLRADQGGRRASLAARTGAALPCRQAVPRRKSIADQLAGLQERRTPARRRASTACTAVVDPGARRRGSPRRGPPAARRALRAGRRQGGRDQGLQRGDQARSLECNRLLQSRQRLRPAGRARPAIADYTEAIKLDPTDPDVFNNRGQAYDTKGEYDSGDRRLHAVDPSQPRQSARLLQPRPGLRQQGRVPSAPSPTSTQAIKLDPRDAEAYVSRGAVHEELGNEAAARADYRKALRDRCRTTRTPRKALGPPRELRLARCKPAGIPNKRGRSGAAQKKRPEQRPDRSLVRWEAEAPRTSYFLLRASMHFWPSC